MTMHRMTGWIPDVPDPRDEEYKAIKTPKLFRAVRLPKEVDLRGQHFPPVFNQGQIGSCVANATSAACAYSISKEDFEKEGYEPWVMSRLFIYYEARGGDPHDNGTYIREAMKSLTRQGVCKEEFWPYVEAKWAEKPDEAAYAEADHREIGVNYFRLDNTNPTDLMDCLAQGYPIVFGATVYDELSFIGPDGRVKMPKPWSKPAGGHAMLIVGYDARQKLWLVRNSWGEDWGDRGHCWFPFDYLCNPNLADDFWTIRHIAK